MTAPTQVLNPGRAVARTVFQLIVGISAALPILVSASGIPQTAVGVGAALAMAALITRVMSLQPVETALKLWVPWLATEPNPPETTASPRNGPAQSGPLP